MLSSLGARPLYQLKHRARIFGPAFCSWQWASNHNYGARFTMTGTGRQTVLQTGE